MYKAKTNVNISIKDMIFIESIESWDNNESKYSILYRATNDKVWLHFLQIGWRIS